MNQYKFPNPIPIGTTSASLYPGEYAFLTLVIEDKFEHTIPTVEIPNDDVLITLYGRDKAEKQLAGASFSRKLLVKLDKPIRQSCPVKED